MLYFLSKMTTFLFVAFAVGVAFIIELFKRLNTLEAETTKLVEELSELFRPVDELAGAQRLRWPERSGAMLTRCPSKKVAERLARHPPSLRALCGFSIWMTKDFAQSVIGLTEDEIEQLTKAVLLTDCLSMLSMLCEHYDTHSVYFSGDKVILRLYDAHDHSYFSPRVLWEHEFQGDDESLWIPGKA